MRKESEFKFFPFTPTGKSVGSRKVTITTESKGLEQGLLRAAKDGKLDKCRSIVEKAGVISFDLNVRDESGDTPLLHLMKRIDENNDPQFSYTDHDRTEVLPDLVELMISHGANVNLLGREQQSSFWQACSENEIDLVRVMVETMRSEDNGKLLFELLANPNIGMVRRGDLKETPWHLAIEKGNFEMLSLLMNAQLQLVIQSRYLLSNSDVVQDNLGGSTFLNCQMQTTSKGNKSFHADGSPVHIAIKQGRHEADVKQMLDILLEELPVNQDADEFVTIFDPDSRDIDGCTALHVLCERGFSSCVYRMLTYVYNKQYVNINIQENVHLMTPIMTAIFHGHEATVEEILRLSPSHVSLSMRSNICGMTPLHLACAHDVEMDRVVLLLCKNKALVKLKESSGYSPLHLATMHGHIMIVKCLLNYNANAAAVDNHEKESALHIAAAYGHINILNVLVRKGGAEVHSENRIGRTALHHAFQRHSFLSSRIENCIENTPASELDTVELSIKEQVKKYILVVERKMIREAIRKRKLNKASGRMGEMALFSFDIHPSSPVERMNKSLGYDMEQLFLALSNQNMLIKLLLDAGGDLDHEDKNGDPAFITTARFDWFDSHEEEMTEICDHPNEKGFDSEIFVDKRTQAAVKTRWIASGQRTRALQELLLWLFYLVVLTSVATRYSGGGLLEGYSMEAALKDRFLGDEWDPYEVKTLGDVGVIDDWYKYLTIPYFQAIYEVSSPYFIANATTGVSRPSLTSKGSLINGAIALVGRPRYRQKRSLADSCTAKMPSVLPQTEETCFSPGYGVFGSMNRAGEDTAPFICVTSSSSFQVNYTANDGARNIDSSYGRYGEGGYSVSLPTDPLEGVALLEQLQQCDFISLNTRIAVLEMTFYSRSAEVFSHVELFLEVTANGGIVTDSRWFTFQVPRFGNDVMNIATEVIWLVLCAFYIYCEISAMFETWGVEYIKERKSPMVWWFTLEKQSRAERREIENPKEFQVILALPAFCCKRTLCMYRTSYPVQPYWVNAFNYLDIVIMMVNISLVSVHVTLLVKTENAKDYWYRNANSDEYIQMHDVLALAYARQMLLACTAFLTYVKSLEYIQVSASLAIPVIIIGGMLEKVSSFFLIFSIFISAFALFDYILFGFTYAPSSSIFKAIVSTFRSSLGDIDFDGKYAAGQNFAVIVTCLVAFLMVILLLNLLIAIMNEAFEEIKSSAEARWCYMQFRMIVDHNRTLYSRKDIRHKLTHALKHVKSFKMMKSPKGSASVMVELSPLGRRRSSGSSVQQPPVVYPREVFMKNRDILGWLERKAHNSVVPSENLDI